MFSGAAAPAAACPDESYNRLFIVASHSEVIYPTQQVDIPRNMTVATLTQLNQSIHLRGGQIPIDQFRGIFSKYGHNALGLAQPVLPTDSDIQEVLSRLRAMEIVYATHHGNPQPLCEMAQRKNEANMTLQMCFLPGSFVQTGIYEFSLVQDGVDVSDAILGPKVDPGMQLYRDTSDKDRLIIQTEKAIMQSHVVPGGFVACPPDQIIMNRSGGNIVQADIDSLRENRTKYRSAIQFEPPIEIFCSHDIADEEQLRKQILELVANHDTAVQPTWVETYHRDQPGTQSVIQDIRLSLKRAGIKLDPLVNMLIHNVIASIHRSKSYADYKTVTSGYNPIRSNELFNKIRRYSGNDNVYVVFIGCRYVPSPDPADHAVMHSPTASGSTGKKQRFGGNRGTVKKFKPRKTLKKMNKKRFAFRSHHRK
jgi:hypothetical protein